MTRRTGIGIVALLVVVLIVALLFARAPAPAASTAIAPQLPQTGQPMLPTTTITITNSAGSPQTMTAELATTPQEEQDGLSDRAGLAEGSGMLFLFDPPQEPGFWMKDMRFSLDIIFAAADGTIVTIYPDLSPATYPQAFRPSAPVRYVLEVPAGFAAAHGIAVGSKIVVQ